MMPWMDEFLAYLQQRWNEIFAAALELFAGILIPMLTLFFMTLGFLIMFRAWGKIKKVLSWAARALLSLLRLKVWAALWLVATVLRAALAVVEWLMTWVRPGSGP